MIYCLAEVFNYRHLARLRGNLVGGIETAVSSAVKVQRGRLPVREDGLFLCSWADGAGEGAASAAAVGLRIRDFLKENRVSLFGFNLLVGVQEDLEPDRVVARLRALLVRAPREEELWLTAEARALLGESYSCVEERDFHRIVAAAAKAPVRDRAGSAPGWSRTPLVGEILEALEPRLNEGSSRHLVHLHGPAGSGKGALLRETLKTLQGGSALPAVRLSTLYKRRSPLHPFLNGLIPQVLLQVSRWLQEPELSVWNDTGRLLQALQEPGAQEVIPDRLMIDFFLAYRLYLLAYVRMRAASLLPAPLILDEPAAYHSAARAQAAAFCAEFDALPDFMVFLTTEEEALPPEFSPFDVRSIRVHPLGRREIRSYAQSVYPGIEIPESAVRDLRRHSQGACGPLDTYLRFLRRTGRITQVGDGFAWLTGPEDERLPPTPLSAAWSMVRLLDAPSLSYCYVLTLAAGLVPRETVPSILSACGFDAEASAQSAGRLAADGLTDGEDPLSPRFPELRRSLEDLLGEDGRRIKEDFLRRLIALWTEKRFDNPVLLFSFLARNGRTAEALAVLPGIIGRKLDESDEVGARAFLDPDRLEFKNAPFGAEKERMRLILACGRLRLSALRGEDGEAAILAAGMEAAEASAGPVSAVKETARDPLRGQLMLGMARTRLALGQSGAALEELKAALMFFQEIGSQEGERAAYLGFGQAMLGEGRIGESLDYLEMADPLFRAAGDLWGSLHVRETLAVSRFLDGRLTRCLALTRVAADDARLLFQRERELFFVFLEARVLMRLGDHASCMDAIQRGLALAAVYGFREAKRVLETYRARCLVLDGSVREGIELLSTLPQNSETLEFLVEAQLLCGRTEEAASCAEKAMAMPAESGFPSVESPSWIDGAYGVEGRCFAYLRGGALRRKELSALRAHLSCVRGASSRGVAELREIVRGEKSGDTDPESYLRQYLYFLSLPADATEEGDDKWTVLSRCLRMLQERAGRIESPADRASFLSRNRWNARIMEEAKARRLT